MNREAGELLARYGVAVDVRRPLRELGVGVQQMVAIARAVSTDARVVDHGRADVLAGAARGREPLRRSSSCCARRASPSLYVSHRLDELFRICDRVTVLRDGRLVHTGAVRDIDRLRLVATMLGRDVAEVREHGSTSFGEDHRVADAAPVLRADGLTRRHLLDDVSLRRPGRARWSGSAGLLGSGRSETAQGDLRRPAGWTPAR